MRQSRLEPTNESDRALVIGAKTNQVLRCQSSRTPLTTSAWFVSFSWLFGLLTDNTKPKTVRETSPKKIDSTCRFWVTPFDL